MKRALFAIGSLLLASLGHALEPKEEVEVTAGAVTARSCALAAVKTSNLSLITSCPLNEAKSGLVIYDVTEKQIYAASKKKVALFELESAFGGGSIDFIGVVKSIDKDGIALVDVSEVSVTKKKKPGSFKGCL